jgi:aminopeptidase
MRLVGQIYEQAKRNAVYVIETILGVTSEEMVALFSDDGSVPVGWAFYEAAVELGLVPVFIVFPSLERTGGEPPLAVSRAIVDTDVYIAVTSPGAKSMTHTRARREASAAGVRGLTLPGMTLELLSREAIIADYQEIAKATTALATYLNSVQELTLLSDNGTHLMFDVRGCTWFAEQGLCRERGQFSNLPGGEVSVAPANAEGVLVVDGSLSPFGKLDNPLVMEIRDRRVVSVRGKQAKALLEFLQPFGPDAFNVAEIGIGMNPAARLCGYVVEDEKVLGTVHVGLGDNSNMGGTTRGRVVAVGVHIDGVVVSEPILVADGSVVNPRSFFSNAIKGKMERKEVK